MFSLTLNDYTSATEALISAKNREGTTQLETAFTEYAGSRALFCTLACKNVPLIREPYSTHD